MDKITKESIQDYLIKKYDEAMPDKEPKNFRNTLKVLRGTNGRTEKRSPQENG